MKRSSLAERLRSAEDVETGPYRIVHEIDVLAAADILEALTAAEARGPQPEQAGWIPPLKDHDDLEQREAVRMTPEYVLYRRDAADRESEMHHQWRTRYKVAEAALAALGPAPQEPPQDDIKMWNTPKSDQTGVVFEAAVDGPRVADLNEQAEYQRGVREGLAHAIQIASAGYNAAEAWEMRALIVDALRLAHRPAGPPTDPASGPPRSASAPEGVK